MGSLSAQLCPFKPLASPLLALHLVRLLVDQASSHLGSFSGCLLYLAWTRLGPKLLAVL